MSDYEWLRRRYADEIEMAVEDGEMDEREAADAMSDWDAGYGDDKEWRWRGEE